MGLVTRGTKAGTGTTNFGTATPALAAEVNTDFNTLYSLVNGNQDNANIAPLGIATSNLANQAVTTGKLADLNVTTGKIANGNVTLAKIAVGAGTSALQSSSTVANGLLFSTVETTIAQLTVTRRGGTFLLVPQIALALDAVGAVDATVTLNYYRDATLIYTLLWDLHPTAAGIAPLTIPWSIDSSQIGTFTYAIKGVTNSVLLRFATGAAVGGAGFLHAIEIA